MKNSRTLFPALCMGIVLVLNGCAGTRLAVLPNEVAAPPGVKENHVVHNGDTVTIILKDGLKISGEVKEVTSTYVLVGQIGNFGYTESLVAATDIEKVELGSGGKIWIPLVVAAGTLVVWSISQLTGPGFN
jgi:hypothetical protein